MYKVKYIRKSSNVFDIRFFKDINELNKWLFNMYDIGEEYYITEIKEES